MRINHIGKIASIALGVATLSACTTYTGYSSASVGYGYNGGYATGYNGYSGYNGYADYPVPGVIAPPLTVVEPSVIVSRPAPIIVEENRRRGFFGRPDYRPNYRNGYANYQRDPRYRDQYHGQHQEQNQGQHQGYDHGRYGNRQNPNTTQANPNPATSTTGTAQPATQNRGDWRNRGQYQQPNGMNGQTQRPRPTYQRPQRYITPTASMPTATPVAH